MDYSALAVSGIAATAAIASAVYARRAQVEVTERKAQLDKESKEEERRSQAKQVPRSL